MGEKELKLPARFEAVGEKTKLFIHQELSYTMTLEEWVYMSKGITEVCHLMTELFKDGVDCIEVQYMGNCINLAKEINEICHEIAMSDLQG